MADRLLSWKIDRAPSTRAALGVILALFGAGCGSSTKPPPPQACGGTGVICTIAGVPGTAGYNGDDIAMDKALLYWPQDVAFSPSGELVILDWNNHRVRACNLQTGRIRTIVGSGFLGDTVGPALEIKMNHPTGVEWDLQGRLIIATWHNWKIERLNPDGNVVTLAGGSVNGFAGDGGPAHPGSLLYLPSSVAFDSLGNMYISDQGNGRIRRILASNGNIETYAGLGARGFFGDGGPASGAQFDLTGSLTGTDASPGGKIAIGPDKDEIYVADSGNNRIRHIELATGIIETVAGTGTAGYAGDGGPATSAELNFPTDVAVGPDHSFYIADSHNHTVRKVDLFGRITTVAGMGVAGFSGDGGAATSAKLDLPCGVFVDKSSVLYIADTYNHVVRRVQL